LDGGRNLAGGRPACAAASASKAEASLTWPAESVTWRSVPRKLAAMRAKAWPNTSCSLFGVIWTVRSPSARQSAAAEVSCR